MNGSAALLRDLLRFALVSGAGLGIDFALFLGACAAGVAPGVANLLSGGCAVAFVYFASVRRVFCDARGFHLGSFAAYLAYQAAALSLASLAVAHLASALSPPASSSPALAKLAILPATFGANYVFMRLLTRPGRTSRPRPEPRPQPRPEPRNA